MPARVLLKHQPWSVVLTDLVEKPTVVSGQTASGRRMTIPWSEVRAVLHAGPGETEPPIDVQAGPPAESETP